MLPLPRTMIPHAPKFAHPIMDDIAERGECVARCYRNYPIIETFTQQQYCYEEHGQFRAFNELVAPCILNQCPKERINQINLDLHRYWCNFCSYNPVVGFEDCEDVKITNRDHGRLWDDSLELVNTHTGGA